MASPRIVLIHNRDFLFACLGEYLAGQGFEVVTVDSVADATERVQATPPDLIIFDIAASRRHATRFLRSISAGAGKLEYPVIVFSDRRNAKDFCLSAGVREFLPRRAFGEELGQKILDVLSAVEMEKRIAARGMRRAILLCEDDSIRAQRIEKALVTAGYHVYRINDGSSVLTTADELHPDAIVIKEYMPNLSGGVAAEELRRWPATKGIPVIVYDETLDRDTGTDSARRQHAGVAEFLPTGRSAVITEAVNRVLAR